MLWRIAKHKKGFVCIIADRPGHKRRIALKAPNKWLAQTEASDLVADIERRRPKENLNVSQIVALYLEQTEAISKQDMIYHFKPVLETLGPMTPDAITEEVCKRYAGDRKRSAGTIRVELGLMNTALKWAKKHKKISEAPWVWMPPAPPPRDRTLTRDEAAALIQASRMPHVRLFAIVALNTGARASAILDLRWQAVDLGQRKVALGGFGRQKKRGQGLPINETLFQALTEAKEAALTPFVIEWAGKPIKDINRSFNLAVKNAGLDRKVTPHVLRHTAASWMAMQRVPFEEIAQFLGHTNPALTFKCYAKFHPDYLQEAAKALG
jgi:integrase